MELELTVNYKVGNRKQRNIGFSIISCRSIAHCHVYKLVVVILKFQLIAKDIDIELCRIFKPKKENAILCDCNSYGIRVLFLLIVFSYN